ncbi:hypothetical protein DFH08DRAFT_800170 [Mycena albidolilacea]|uniref:Uncharacterized protein n=1 Tax=Mycena albidolilacea TaxID=1033008 RepID=A0AAD7EZ79_9AGAR|nr:hypothetical protein DFH08DRAFT_800170 [Mycena albidolilacea]
MTTNESDFTFPRLAGTETAIFPAASAMEFHNIDPSTFYISPAPRAKSSRAPLQIPATPTPTAQLPTVPPSTQPRLRAPRRTIFCGLVSGGLNKNNGPAVRCLVPADPTGLLERLSDVLRHTKH